MRLLINAASANVGGGVTYIRNTLKAFDHIPGASVSAYVPNHTYNLLRTELSNVDLRRYPFSKTSGAQRMYFDQMVIPRVLRSEGFDALFSSTGFGTYSSPRPQLLLIRNSIYFEPKFDRYYRTIDPTTPSRMFRRALTAQSIRAADVVLFPTAAMQDQVAQYVSIGKRRCAVVPYGFDRDAFSAGSEPEIVARMREWRSAGSLVLLNVSTYYVQKNLETLVKALPALRARGPVKFVTTVSREHTQFKREYDRFVELVNSLGLQDTVAFAGHVPHAQLGSLYEAADLFVFPSFTESFGHPLLEAMATSLPVVAADTAVNRELCGDCARYFTTFDAVACAEAITSLADDVPARAAMAAAGRERVAQFTWEAHANRLLELTESVCAV